MSVGVKQLREQFGVPLGEAAKALGISRTAMKKACRRHGLDEWPYKRRKSKGSAAFGSDFGLAVISVSIIPINHSVVRRW